MTITIDVEEAKELIERLLKEDKFVEAQWVEGLTAYGEEYGKFVTEDVCGFWGDEFRFGDLETFGAEDPDVIRAWVISNLPNTGEVRVIYV